MLSLRIYLRASRKDAAGQSVIYFIIGEEYISSTIKVAAEYWDPDHSCILKKHPKYYVINPHFDQLKSRAMQCISNFQTNQKPFNRRLFEAFVFGNQDDAGDTPFNNLVNEYIDSGNVGAGRIKQLQGLKKDVEGVKPGAALNDINYDFVLKFQQYLRNKKTKNNAITINHKIKALKTIVHFAQKKGLLTADPLAMVKLKQLEGKKNHLTAAELEELEKLYNTGMIAAGYLNVLKYFLFSCYTGLRFSDVLALKYSDIQNNCVVTTQEKTDKPVVVPLISKAKALLNTHGTGLCFKVNTNQVTNRFLKPIMMAAGIDKKITYHCSRHTFATLSIYWGIPIEVVAELMGLDFKTVKIYAKIVDEVKAREMLKWEQAG